MNTTAEATVKPAIKYTAQQQSAFELIRAFATGEHGAAMMTLAGYAGTGKTTLVSGLVRDLAEDISIAIAAPTNKAVSVLRDKIKDSYGSVDFGSIHSFMGLRLKEQDDGRHQIVPEGDSSIHDYNLVIVDECSMLSQALFGHLVMLTGPTDTRVLFVGDPAQLPPVDDDGAESPTFTHVQHKAVLTDIVRQAADSPIIKLSMRIRESIEANRRMSNADIQDAIPAAPADALLTHGGYNTAYNWALHDIREGMDTRILAFRNETVLRYNREIHAAMHGYATPFNVGETVMMNSSHDARACEDEANPMKNGRVNLYNSEELTVVAIQPEPHPYHRDVPAWRLKLRRDSGAIVLCWVADNAQQLNAKVTELFNRAAAMKRQIQVDRMLPATMRKAESDDAERKAIIKDAWAHKNNLADVRHVYSMTVHKSQGSTLDTAIVDLSDLGRIRGDFDYNRSLYVATTRASKHLAFVV